MTYEVKIKKSARKEILKLDEKNKNKIKEALQFLSINPNSSILNIKKLKVSYELYRLRVGNYRIIYEIRNKELVVIVIRVRHRKDAYKKL